MFAPIRFGRYLATRELGRGGMGVVYFAADPNTFEPVAIKLLSTTIPSAEARFKREFRVLQRLESRYVVRVLELGEVETGTYIAMEFITGKDLSNWQVPTTPEMLEQTIQLAAQIAHGLADVHHAGVIHRDLKPENLLLDDQNRPRISDFGLARDDQASIAISAGSKNAFMGTLLYASPEQIQARDLDHRTDLYAFGMVLYRLLTGRTAFEGREMPALILAHLREIPDAPSKHNALIPPALDRLILRLLEKSPKERFDSADDVRLVLENMQPEVKNAAVGQTQLGLGSSQIFEPSQFARGLLEPPLLGREALIGQVLHCQTPAVLLEGEVGVGKTRLLRELVRHHVFNGSRALEAVATGQFPLEVLSQWLRAALQRRDAPEIQDLLRTDGAILANLMPELGITPIPLLGEQALFSLYASLWRVLQWLAQHHPVVLSLDNAEHLDEGSLGFLGYVLRGIGQQPIRVLLAGRSEKISERLRASLKALESDQKLESLPVPPLEAAEIAQAIKAMLGYPCDDALIRYISQRSLGNPWMAGELLRALIESGEVFQSKRYWEWTRVSANLTPDLRETLRLRFAKLEPSAQDLAATAAVIGEVCEFEPLLALSQLPEDALLDDLERLIRGKILLEERKGRSEQYRFAHPLLQDAAVEHLGTRKRRRLHQRHAEHLATRGAEPALLARHLVAAEDPSAIAVVLEACQKADALYMLPQLESLTRATLAYIGEDPHEHKAMLELFLGRMAMQVGRSDEAEQVFERIFQTEPSLETPARVALAELYERTGRSKKVLELLEGVVEGLGSEKAWYYYIFASQTQGEYFRALQGCDCLLAMSGVNDYWVASVHFVKGVIYREFANLESAKTELNIAVELSIKKDFIRLLPRAYTVLGHVARDEENYELQKQYYEKAKPYFLQTEDYRAVASGMLNLCQQRYEVSEIDEAIELALQVVELAKKANFTDILGLANYNLGCFFEELSELQKAKLYFTEAISVLADEKHAYSIASFEAIEEINRSQN